MTTLVGGRVPLCGGVLLAGRAKSRPRPASSLSPYVRSLSRYVRSLSRDVRSLSPYFRSLSRYVRSLSPVERNKACDVVDPSGARFPPGGLYSHTGGHGGGVVDVDRVEHCAVGAVELDQCPGERFRERLSGKGFRLPRPAGHDARGTHLDELVGGASGARVELGGRYQDASVGGAPAEDPSLAQCECERRQDWSEGAGVVEGDREIGFQDLGLRCGNLDLGARPHGSGCCARGHTRSRTGSSLLRKGLLAVGRLPGAVRTSWSSRSPSPLLRRTGWLRRRRRRSRSHSGWSLCVVRHRRAGRWSAVPRRRGRRRGSRW